MKRYKNFGLSFGIAFSVTIALLSWWIYYLCTLPKIEEQLKFSPFKVEGTWQCEEMDMTITSTKEEAVTAIFEGDTDHPYKLYYLSTRGFSHKYAVVLYIEDEEMTTSYSCEYEFQEGSFILKAFEYQKGTKLFEGTKELHFTKVG